MVVFSAPGYDRSRSQDERPDESKKPLYVKRDDDEDMDEDKKRLMEEDARVGCLVTRNCAADRIHIPCRRATSPGLQVLGYKFLELR